jgi:hypothetical protein
METPVTTPVKPEAPKKQPREHAVRCRRCLKRETWNHDAICDPCKEDKK